MTPVPRRTREEVRKRADNRCEYCRMPEGYTGHSHQIDHIIPVKHEGSSRSENLAWACFDCNNTKGTDISAYHPETGKLTPLFNPRVEYWNSHFEINNGLIVGKTAIGDVTTRILKMNDDRRVYLRRVLVEQNLYS